jgi:hypothetical protein
VVYGHITVTQIINLMRTDAIGGGHPELRWGTMVEMVDFLHYVHTS